MNMKNYRILGQLLGCYFHQDWPEEFSNSSGVIHEIINSESRDRLLAGASELDQLIALNLSEEACREIMIAKIGCFFEPGSEGLTYADWLLRVRAAFLEQ
ncbi:contact-dependent growth inhibition system immunity protein [Pseudomonas sp.]|uniref:contact-dependent growth inhibition system immunity protein n=1 Tax=Pseudomonas sp. TaxID=306 RepID=UPI003A979FFE